MKYFPFGIVKVSGNSMLPTLKPGQYCLVSPLPYYFSKPKPGDIIVAALPNKEVIKRIKTANTEGYFIVGDNENESTDSRNFGLIKGNKILAKIVF